MERFVLRWSCWQKHAAFWGVWVKVNVERQAASKVLENTSDTCSVLRKSGVAFMAATALFSAARKQNKAECQWGSSQPILHYTPEHTLSNLEHSEHAPPLFTTIWILLTLNSIAWIMTLKLLLPLTVHKSGLFLYKVLPMKSVHSEICRLVSTTAALFLEGDAATGLFLKLKWHFERSMPTKPIQKLLAYYIWDHKHHISTAGPQCSINCSIRQVILDVDTQTKLLIHPLKLIDKHGPTTDLTWIWQPHQIVIELSDIMFSSPIFLSAESDISVMSVFSVNKFYLSCWFKRWYICGLCEALVTKDWWAPDQKMEL